MKLGVMQPYFLPYIGYFQLIEAVDKYILYSNLNFSKRGWSNRNRILMKAGTINTITVPLESQSSSLLINQIKVFNKINWKDKLLKTIYLNYKGAPYFDEVYPFLEKLFMYQFEYLYQLNGFIIKNICNFIGITTEIEYENHINYSELEKKLLNIENNDFHQFPYMQEIKPDKRVARIIEICRTENIHIYVNAIGGQNLYYKKIFADLEIDLRFIKMQEFEYPQFFNSFAPNLSIVDVLMHNGSEGTLNLIKKYIFV